MPVRGVEQAPPIPIDARQLARGRGGDRLLADPGKGHAGRQHQPLLRASDDDIDAPFVGAEIHRGERGDHVDQVEGRVAGGVDRAAQRRDIVDDPGRGFAVHDQHCLDLVLAILAQPRFEPRRVDRAAPVVRQGLDFEAEGFAAQPPVQREEPALDDQHLVAGREQVDERGFPGAVAGGGVTQNRRFGLEHALEAREAFLLDRAKIGAVEIGRAAVHRPQHPIRNIGRTRVHEEMNAVRHRLTCAWSQHRRPGRRRARRIAARARNTIAGGDAGRTRQARSAVGGVAVGLGRR